MFKYTVAL